MPLRFTVLASGSSGNASLIEANGFGVLIDAGIGPRRLARDLEQAGCSWESIHAVLLTHAHGDHWNERLLVHLFRRRTPIHCHADHARQLRLASPAFGALEDARLVRCYDGDRALSFGAGLRCGLLPLWHDSDSTFGFRFEAGGDLFTRPCALGYVADLGCWDDRLADSLADVDLLALEFNHDEAMERSSGRARGLIARVLGDDGHLSNDQAAGLLGAVLGRSRRGRLAQLVQLHLSRQCNRPALALSAARRVLLHCDHPLRVHTALQTVVSPTFHLGLPLVPSLTDLQAAAS